jgi:antitoxin component YwqK of YwqJK toxin-antitoxin module
MKIMVLLLLIAGTEPYESRHPNGKLCEKGVTLDGQRHGRWRAWYKTGQLAMVNHYEKGVLHGAYKTFHHTGEAHVTATYKKGKLHGRHVSLYPNGQKHHDWRYVDGVLQGNVNRTYWVSGKLQSETRVLNRELQIELRLRYHENGKKESEGTFKNGQHDGKWSTWHSNGRPRQEIHYKNGRRDGWDRYWHVSGRLESERLYKNGKAAK